MDREWLDVDGSFLFGKHEGETVERVCREDPGYLRWILETVENILDEDRMVIQAMMDRGRRRG